MTLKVIVKLFPWIVIVILGAVLYLKSINASNEPTREVMSNTVLREIEALGKLELVRYNFQEITEMTQLSPEILNIFKWDRDSKIVLISSGNAVACIDLAKISIEDINVDSDGVEIRLPAPELCYYKLDMEKSRIYSLITGYTVAREEFIQEAYRHAENQVRDAALASGILEQAKGMTTQVLLPFLSRVTGKNVTLTFDESRPLDLEIPALNP